MEIKCPKCQSSDLSVYVKTVIKIPPRYFSRLSKKAIKDKDVQLQYAFWDEATWFCKCGWSNI